MNELPAHWRQVRLVTITRDNYPHTAAFAELVEALREAFAQLGVCVETATNSLSGDGVNIVFGAHLLDEPAARRLPANTVLFNLEQLDGIGLEAKRVYAGLLARFPVWDYSPRNIAKCRALLGNPRVHRLGIGFTPTLARIPRVEQQPVDVLFYGSLNERRRAVLEGLRQAGLRVHHLFNVYGAERDAAIATAKVVLNLHFYADSIHEVVRTSYLLANAKAVVSECGPDTEIDEDLRQSLLAVPYEGLVDACIALVRDDERRRRLEDEGFARFSRRSQAAMLAAAIADTSPPLPRLINLGSGKSWDRNCLNIDIDPKWQPDLLADLSQPGWLGRPFVNARFGLQRLTPGSFDAIVARDVLEHVPALPQLMTCCLELLREGGQMHINVPYDLSWGAWQDPTHVRAFNERSWLYYTDWHWYLGWLEARFDLTALKMVLSPLGNSLREGRTAEELYRTPRAVDSMEVVLVKRRLSEQERVGAEQRHRGAQRPAPPPPPPPPPADAAPAEPLLLQEALALYRQGQPRQSLTLLEQALAQQPGQVRLLNLAGAAAYALGALEQAERHWRAAIAARPDFATAHNNLGGLLQDQGRLQEALAAYRRAVACNPDYPEAIGQLHHLCRHTCDWGDLAEREAQVRALVRAGAGDISPFSFLALRAPLAEQAACARHWAKRRATVAAGTVFSHTPGRHHGRIRLGYLSADFHEHATAYLMAELFERHDRGNFEVIGYSYGPDERSPMRARLQRAFDRFVDLRGLPPAAAAARLHADAVDILVDLKGYTQSALPAILAHRPAPVQVNWLGYPGTLGAPFIDYLIADAFVAPFAHQDFYDEALVHLPGCYQPNDTQRAIAERTPTRAQCGLPETGFVFCCFNNSYKLTPEFFAIWMRLLAATPGSVLWLLAANALVRDNLRREAAARGVDPARLVFAPRLPLPEHLARQRLADLFLDTLPFNAHTTASDALWAGLPLLTCVGETFAGRVGGSLLQAVGLPELVTDTPAAYEALALRLAHEPALLAALHARLAANRLSAPLFDSARFTRHLEAAYQRMWERHRVGHGPAAFAVADDGQLTAPAAA